MVPFEAFLSAKPVVTTTDAGGPLEVVHDRETGIVVAPRAAELAQACTYLGAHVEEAKAWGRAGQSVASRVTWDSCLDALLA
jgi:glycosyltransferase involved in cell wall biosynthesis